MRHLLFIALLFLSMGLSVLTGRPANGQVVPVPQAAENCVNRDDHFAAGGAELIASEAVEGTDYYLIHTYEDSPDAEQFPSALLVSSASSDACEVALWNTPGDYLQYADFVPYEAAVKFREIEYGITLESMGREQFVNSFSSPDDLDLFPEFLDAFERLGVLDAIEARLGV